MKTKPSALFAHSHFPCPALLPCPEDRPRHVKGRKAKVKGKPRRSARSSAQHVSPKHIKSPAEKGERKYPKGKREKN